MRTDLTLLRFGALGAAALALSAGPAFAKDKPRLDIEPYVELDQVVFADLGNGGDVLTYSTVAAGVDATIATRNAEGTVSLRYERTITYDDRMEDQDTISGLGRVGVQVGKHLTLEAGGLAARTRVDGAGAVPGSIIGNIDNVSQVYSVYAGPTFAAQIGNGVEVGASYRIGYTKVESAEVGVLPGGVQPIDIFDDSVSQAASVSIGAQPGGLPVGWSVSAGWAREDGGQLDHRFDDKYVRGDLTVPVSSTLAVVGGVGYEKIEISERDAVRDADGDPVFDDNGQLVVDTNSPRLLAYEQDGIIWDVGVMWRPSRRTSLEARVGQRYGDMTYIGSFSWAPRSDMAVGVIAYDTVTSYGDFLNDNLSRLPTSFSSIRNPLTGDLQGCAFGGSGALCLNDLLQQASSASFRSRGVTASFTMNRFGWDTGIAAGWSRRDYIASQLGAQAQIDGTVSDNYFVDWFLGRQLDQNSSFGANAYANLFKPNTLAGYDIFTLGANANYQRRIYGGLQGTVAVGIDHSRQEEFDRQTTASALLGLRYNF